MTLIALLSGGLDSTVALALSLRRDPDAGATALFFDYGQRNLGAELRASTAIAARLGIEHRVIGLPFLAEMASGPLVEEQGELPRPGEAGIESGSLGARQSADAVWIPHRNGLFLAIAASLADSRGGGRIVAGFNREEAETFPDNSVAFLEATNRALQLGARGDVRVESPTAGMDKTEIVAAGIQAEAPLALIHSCYEDRDPACGTCEPCLRLRRALTGSGYLEEFVRLKGWEEFPGS